MLAEPAIRGSGKPRRAPLADRADAVRLVVATRNEHKLRELGEILTGVELVPLPLEVELPPEDGDTFAANALIKAPPRSGDLGAAIADDSGSSAAALGGRPGVRRPLRPKAQATRRTSRA